ncbi:MAG: Jag N-terminal domain-containing protein [Clostridia bacterium]|nr:Jag N-terminal domain-containing protein [Clostridia bacterium]
MSQELIVTGKDVDEAVVNARQILTKENPDAEIGYSIIETGSKGIFGIIGVKPAKIKAYIVGEEPTAEEKEADGAKTERRSGNRRDNNRRGNRNRRGGNRDKANNAEIAAAIASAPKTKQTPKKPIVPEADLQMTKVEVSAGDDASMDFVCRLIDNLGINVGAELYRCEDGTRRIVLTGDDAGVLIGHHGETLDALQYLSNLACTKKNENGERDHSRVTLDIQGYRAKREETLRALARAKAQKALRTGRNVMLEPMNAYERRIIHSEIQTISGVSTNSIGSDNNRKVVIYLVDAEEKDSANENAEALYAPTEDENA